MTGLSSALRDATSALDGISPTPRLDAELLLAYALGTDRSHMLLRQHDLQVPDNFAQLLARRIASEPVAYITGVQAFWDFDLVVSPAVLIPRADSETLLEAASDCFGTDAPSNILDLGTGSGALLLAALTVFQEAVGMGVDASPAALSVASLNAERLNLVARAQFQLRDWTKAGWFEGLGRFDLILCNPPYIEKDAVLDPMVFAYEPHHALFAGDDGLDDYRLLLPLLSRLLQPHGTALFEIGYKQADAVCGLGQEAGFLTELRYDLAGNPRVVRFSLGIEEYND